MFVKVDFSARINCNMLMLNDLKHTRTLSLSHTHAHTQGEVLPFFKKKILTNLLNPSAGNQKNSKKS